jgi:hypothetical protein
MGSALAWIETLDSSQETSRIRKVLSGYLEPEEFQHPDHALLSIECLLRLPLDDPALFSGYDVVFFMETSQVSLQQPPGQLWYLAESIPATVLARRPKLRFREEEWAAGMKRMHVQVGLGSGERVILLAQDMPGLAPESMTQIDWPL